MNAIAAKNMINADTKIVAYKDVISAELGDEMSLLNMKTGVYFTLNAMAAEIWKQIQTPTLVSDLQSFVSTNYEVLPEQCEKDLRLLFESLLAEQLVEVVQ
jgi:wyosine [tRNA(Phe)-imidazoG37] synthetase (radical SAM superfamily)